jgi:hypothetical protein
MKRERQLYQALRAHKSDLEITECVRALDQEIMDRRIEAAQQLLEWLEQELQIDPKASPRRPYLILKLAGGSAILATHRRIGALTGKPTLRPSLQAEGVSALGHRFHEVEPPRARIDLRSDPETHKMQVVARAGQRLERVRRERPAKMRAERVGGGVEFEKHWVVGHSIETTGPPLRSGQAPSRLVVALRAYVNLRPICALWPRPPRVLGRKPA